MQPKRLDQLDLHHHLADHAKRMNAPAMHLKHLLEDSSRFSEYTKNGGGLFLDYSRQRLTEKTLDLLSKAAAELNLHKRFEQMCRGTKINVTENRAVLHTATRNVDDHPIILDGHDVTADIRRVCAEMKQFSDGVHKGEIKGSTGLPFRHVVVVGIGGSYLGTEFVSTALAAQADKGI
ncbi:MAG: glucose-6-phosphate isomerase, partial [Desulfobacteraceae bacterium]